MQPCAAGQWRDGTTFATFYCTTTRIRPCWYPLQPVHSQKISRCRNIATARCWFLPPCRPNFNPIKSPSKSCKLKLKAQSDLCRMGARKPVRSTGLHLGFDPKACGTYVKAAGYVSNEMQTDLEISSHGLGRSSHSSDSIRRLSPSGSSYWLLRKV